MFEVRCHSPLDETWEERDVLILYAAGSQAAASGTATTPGGAGQREHMWRAGTWGAAKDLRERLERVPGVRAKIREATTG